MGEGVKMSEPTDDELMSALQGGDEDAIALLFDRYYDELFAYADRMLADPHAGADAVQDSFVRLLKYRSSYEGRTTFSSWMLRIVRNVCLNVVDEGRRRSEIAHALPQPEPVAPPRTPDPRVAQLRDALAELTPGRREVLLLRRFHGLSYAEISQLLGISEGAARVAAHRALKDLARTLASAESRIG